MRRTFTRFLLILALGVALLGWLAGTTGGLRTLLGLAGTLSGERLSATVGDGSLLGPLHLTRLDWQDDTLSVGVDELAVDWSPSELFAGNLRVDRISAGRLAIRSTPSDEAAVVPSDLRLPLRVALAELTIGELQVDALPAVHDIALALHSDGRQHRIDGLRLTSDRIALAGRLALDGAAPFGLDGDFELSGRVADQPLSLAGELSGELAAVDLVAQAKTGLDGHLAARLTPFAATPFAHAEIDLRGIDPARWLADAPVAELRLNARLQPAGQGIAGDFRLENRRAGPVDRERLPLETLSGDIDWQADGARIDRLQARLPGGGTLTGNARWQAQTLSMTLRAERVDAARLVAALVPSRLSGALELRAGAQGQSVRAELSDPRLRLALDAERSADGRIAARRLELQAGDARLQASGELAADAGQAFRLNGELARFDPSRFARVPAALINARFSAAGRLAPKPTVDAEFVLRDSQLAGQALRGQGKASIAWPAIPAFELALDAGANQLRGQGSWGGRDGRLSLRIDAPQLAPYGLEGGLSGQLQLAGTSQAASLDLELHADRLGQPGAWRIEGLAAKAVAGLSPDAPLRIDLALNRLAAADDWLARGVTLQGEGTTAAHRLQLDGQLPGPQRLQLTARGGLRDAGWRGSLETLNLLGDDRETAARNLRLSAPAALTLNASGGSLEARLRGDPLDWQADLKASAEATRLNVEVHARGSRIGRVDAQLRAPLSAPWQLAGDAPWQGGLRADIPDIGWLGELIGEGWRSEGQLRADLTLAGTPARPALNGPIQGERLALRLAEQGMQLVDGKLAARFATDRLYVDTLRFSSLLSKPPRALRNALGEQAAAFDKPGSVEISGEISVGTPVDRKNGGERAALDVRLDRFGPWQLPEQWLAVSGKGRIDWQDGGLGVRGQFMADAGYWQLAPGGAPRLSEDVTIKRPGRTAPPTPRTRLELDVETDLGRRFLFSGAGLSSRLTGKVRLTASGYDLPKASGTIQVRDGRFDAYGQKLEIERGILSFDGLLDDPRLDVLAVRKGLSVEPGVRVSGTARRPVVRLVSDPDLPDAEKIAWLVLGHGSENMSAGDAGVLLSAAGGLLGNDSGGVVQQIRDTFGFDELGVRQGSLNGSTRTPTSRIAGGGSTVNTASDQIFTVGKRLSSNTTLSYEQVLGRAEGVVKLSVALTRQLSVVGRAGSDNALDLLYTITLGQPERRKRNPPGNR